MELPLPQPSTTPLPSPFVGVDWYVVAYAAFMATLIGVLMTMRQRNSQAARGLPLQPWHRLIPEVALGTLSGTLAALTLPQFFPWLHTLSGLALISGFGSLMGPKLFDWADKNGWQALLRYLAAKAAGPLATIAATAAEQDAANTPEGGEPHDEIYPPSQPSIASTTSDPPADAPGAGGSAESHRG